MVRQAGLDFSTLEESKFDSFMGESTGAAVIFGTTGGVMEAALRTAYEIVTGREVPFKNLNMSQYAEWTGSRRLRSKSKKSRRSGIFLRRGIKGCGRPRPCQRKKAYEEARGGASPYHFVEIMACPGGWIGGGGQPIPTSPDIRKKRMNAIYAADEALPLRKSHDNPEVQMLYKDFLEEPLGHKSHELLHTHYTKRI